MTPGIQSDWTWNCAHELSFNVGNHCSISMVKKYTASCSGKFNMRGHDHLQEFLEQYTSFRYGMRSVKLGAWFLKVVEWVHLKAVLRIIFSLDIVDTWRWKLIETITRVYNALNLIFS
ncbi:hypothetical protein M758_2G178300 [Ceratodon purpureus]|nr:hypothetical protein M758_2G178300 [Ceratodon purpureus]